MANQRANRCNKLGIKGVCAVPGGKFMASIMRAGKLNYLGVFSTPDQAHQAYTKAAIQLNGEFARTA